MLNGPLLFLIHKDFRPVAFGHFLSPKKMVGMSDQKCLMSSHYCIEQCWYLLHNYFVYSRPTGIRDRKDAVIRRFATKI